MGLSGRKVKQRIGADPRNLTWADDAAKFGQAYLTKLGWDPSRGLGASGDGRTSHIKVTHKLNLLGIGAGNVSGMGDETVAWKQNREYEMLLKRLNEAGQGSNDEEGTADEDEGKEKKRKRDGDVGSEVSDVKDKKRQRKEKKDKKERKKKRKDKTEKIEKSENDEEEDKTQKPSEPETTESSPLPTVIRAPIPRPMAHRARFLRSKQLASRSSTAVAEILGISSSSSDSPSPSSLTATSFPPSSESQTPVPETNHGLRTANTSVGDYFKEKLAARALMRAESSSTRPSPPSSCAPHPNSPPVRGNVANASRTEDGDDAPRAGLGSRSVYNHSDENKDGDAPRVGLGAKFGSLMGGFMSPNVTSSAHSTRPENEELPSASPEKGKTVSGDERTSKGEKRKKKEKRRRKGEASELAVNNEPPRDGESTGAAEIEPSTRRKEKRERSEKKRKRKEEKEKRQEDTPS